MYSFPDLEPVCCSMSGSNRCFLTCIHISQEAGQVVCIPMSLRIFHSLLWSTQVKGFGMVNKAEVDVFLELSCFFYDPTDVGNLTSGVFAFSKSSLNMWKFSVYAQLKTCLENFEHYFASLWDGCSYAVAWTFFSIAFLWHWNENWPFSVLWPLLSVPNLLAYWVEHFNNVTF